MRIYRVISCFLILAIFGGSATSQVISSNKQSFRLNNMPVEQPKEIIDELAPELKIISPSLSFTQVNELSSSTLKLVGKVEDMSGVSSLIIDGQLTEYAESGVFSAVFELEEGTYEIPIIAHDSKGNMLQTKLELNYVAPVVTLADMIAQESKYYALIIGVNKYKDPEIQDLDNPIRDAQMLRDALVEHYTFEEENVKFVKNATRRDIISSLDQLSTVVTSNDNLLIFYAGHGWWDENANNGYWLPADAESDNKIDWFRNSTLVDYLKEVNSKHTLLITDACFGGAIFKTRSAFSDAPTAIEMLYDMPSRKAMTSGTLTEVPDQSSFIKYMVQKLKSNEEKYLPSEQLFSSFRIAVINNSQAVPQYGEIQSVGDQGGDFIFIKK